MKAIDIMNEEHRCILRILKVVRVLCFKILKGEEIVYEDFDKVIEFIQNYADKHHHKKEEDILFSKMIENLGERGEKVIKQGMLVEHDLGRLYIRNLVEALEKVKLGQEEVKLDVIANAISYTELLTRHIDKEDKVIYKYAERELKAEILEFIDIKCENFELDNCDVKNKYLLLLEALEKKY